MKKNNFLMALLLTTFLGLGINLMAEETTAEKIETSTNKGVDNVKSTYRNAKNEVCEMINGKMKCIGKKIKNKAKDLKDKASTKATEIKNKTN